MRASRTRSRPSRRSSAATAKPSPDGANSWAVSPECGSKAKPHTTSRSKPAPRIASLAASLTWSGPTVPCSGPRLIADPARLAVGVGELALGLDPRAGVEVEPVEADVLALEGVLHAGLAQVVEDRLLERRARRRRSAAALSVPVGGGRSSSSTRCGERLSTVNGPVTRTFLRSSYGWSTSISLSACRAIAASISSRLMPSLDVRVLRDRLQRDVRHPPVDEALADVAGVAVAAGGWPVSSASLAAPSASRRAGSTGSERT